MNELYRDQADLRSKVVLIQATTESVRALHGDTTDALHATVNESVGRINGAYGQLVNSTGEGC
jgi:trehalose-6-phosphate synthase